MANYLNAKHGDKFYKVAYIDKIEIAREIAIEPITIDEKFNHDELMSFCHRVMRENKIEYSEENPIQIGVIYEKIIEGVVK